jgi:hypothetical protein
MVGGIEAERRERDGGREGEGEIHFLAKLKPSSKECQCDRIGRNFRHW